MHPEIKHQSLAPKPRRKRALIESLVGNTPLLDLSHYSPNPEKIAIYAKAEWFNPGYSVKDRAALSMVRSALDSGQLDRGKRLLDASSGNTALAYAMFGAALGFGVTLCVPENVSPAQKAMLQAYGAETIYTSAQEGSDGAILKARQLLKSHPEKYFYADQYSNPANWQAHYRTTAPEIWQQTRGKITHFIAGLGTSGTFMGTGRRLREWKPFIQLIAVQPDSPFHGIEGWKHMATSLAPAIYESRLADRHMSVTTEAAYAMVKCLARQDGFLVGLSSGAVLAATIEVAQKLDRGVLVTLFPDGGQRYLEQAFWDKS